MQKEQLEFGQGSFVGEIMKNPDFFDMDSREQARILGWADSCPVVTELTDPTNHKPGRGPESMLNRYGEVNFWFGEITRAAHDTNPELYEQLVSPVERRLNEPVGKYEVESVPESHAREMSPMGTLAGYALPRILIEFLDEGVDSNIVDRQNRLERAWQQLGVATIESQTPIELLAAFSERLVHFEGLSPDKVFKHALSKGWLDEHNAHSMNSEFKDAMQLAAPTLWQSYDEMPKVE